VDISALESDFEAHELATAMAGHSGIGEHDHEDAAGGGQLDHGLALTGLGDDDHTQYLNTARHLAIGDASPHHAAATAGDGIAVTGQQVAVDLATNSLLEFSSGGDLRVSAAAAGDGLTGGGGVALAVDLHGTWSGLEISSAQLRVDQDAVFTWTHLHTFNAGIDVDGTLEFQGAEQITTTSGNLTILPVGDLVLSPAGEDVRPGTTVGVDLGEYNYKWRTLYAAELYVETLVAQDVMATIGGRILVAPTTKLTAAMTNVQNFIYVEHNNLAVDDYVMLESAPGGVAQFEIMQILTDPSPAGPPFLYTVSRDEDGTGANTWQSGDAVANLGYAVGEGYLELTSTSTVHTDLGPNMTIYARTGTANWDDVAATVAVGNLESFLDYSAAEFGVAAGDDLSLNPAAGGVSGFSIDRTNGLRLWNTGVKLYDGSDLRIEMDPTATGTDAMFWAGPSSSDKRFVVTGDGDVWLSTLAISEGMGEWLFSQADGLLLLGQPLKVLKEGGVNYWGGTRGERATVSGALHTEQGRWTGSRGVVVEEATTNLCTNPSFEIGTTGWGTGGSNTIASSTVWSMRGNRSLKCTYQDNTVLASDSITVPAAGDYTLTAWVYVPQDWDGGIIYLSDSGFTGATREYRAISADVMGQWVRIETGVTVDAGDLSGSFRVNTNSAPSAGKFIYVDAVMWEQLDHATSYCDGDQGDGYAWSGTVHASTSARTATGVNLDALVGLISGNDAMSIVAWVQMPYDYDATWPHSTSVYVMDAYDVAGRIIMEYRAANNVFRVFNGTTWVAASEIQFSAGDWLCLAYTLDYGNDEYYLYCNGELVASDITAALAGTLSQWRLGSRYSGSQIGNFTFAEFATFDRVLTADEVAGMYAGQRPLVDGGAIERPGIYILDGEFRLQSSQTGQRVEMLPEGIGIYDETGYTGVARLLGGRVDTTGKTLDAEGDALGWFGYDGDDALQVAWYAAGDDAGKIVAGSGALWLDEDGISIEIGSSKANGRAYKFLDSSGNVVSGIFGYLGVHNVVDIDVEPVASKQSDLNLTASGGSGGYYGRIVLKAESDGDADTAELEIYSDGISRYVDSNVSIICDDDFRSGGGLVVGNASVNPNAEQIHFGSATYRLRRNGTHIEWYNGASWVQLD
jgi:hypothetical protein